jgi:thiol-disulfide isomerase/thioredoxin
MRAQNSASSSDQTVPGAPIPDFRGTWVEEDPLDSAHPMRLRIAQSKSIITVYISYTQKFAGAGYTAAVGQGQATWEEHQGCAERFWLPGYNYDNPGFNTFRLSLQGTTLKYEQETHWLVPCDGHPAGVETVTRELGRTSEQISGASSGGTAPTPQANEAPSAANAGSQPPAPARPRNLSEAEAALQQGRLTIWVPNAFVRGMPSLPAYERYHDYSWEGLQKEFRTDFPKIDLRFVEMDRDEFIRLMHSSPQEAHFPDVAFADNYGEVRPLLRDGAAIKMWGQSRLNAGFGGWWLVFRQSRNFAAGESFLLWASQRFHWTPWSVSTNTLGPADRAAVHEISQQVVRDFAKEDVPSLQAAMDPDAAHFEILGPDAGGQTVLSSDPVLTFGNSRLAFVLMAALGEGSESFGMAHFGLILRKTEAGWKVWYFLPSRSLPELVEFFQPFDCLGLEETGGQALPKVKLLAPAEHEQPSGLPPPEIEWATLDAPVATYVVESQFGESWTGRWAASTLELVSPVSVEPSIRKEAPLGGRREEGRRRVWAISKAGVVSTSEWQDINFTSAPRPAAKISAPVETPVAVIEPACMEWVEAAERGQPMIAPHITIRYNPQAPGARLKSAQSLTLAIANRRGIGFDTHRIPMTRAADGAWQAVFVPERNYIPGYAIFFFQDEKGAIDNHGGEYWDILKCHRGEPDSFSVAARASTYDGQLLAPGIQRVPNLARAVEILKEDLREDPHDYLRYSSLWTEELRMGNESPSAYEQVGKEIDAFVADYGDQYHALRQISSFVAYRQQKLPPGTVQRFRQGITPLMENAAQFYRRAGIPSSPAENPRLQTGIQRQVTDMLADLDYWPITWEQGNLQKQAEDYLAFVNTHPESIRTRDAYEGAFTCELEMKDASGAEGVLEKLMALDRDRPEPLTQMARFYVEQKAKLVRAVQLLDRAETILKNQEAHYAPELFKRQTGEINLLRGQAHMLLDDLPHARTDFEAAVRATPDDPKALLALGEVREKMGDSTQALAAYLAAASAPYQENSAPREAYERLFAAQKLGTSQDAEQKILERTAQNTNRAAAEYTPVAMNRPAPQFAFTDLAGKRFDNQAAKGKPTILTFWGVWCAPCVAEMPAMQEFQRRHPEVNILAVEVGSKPEEVKTFLSTHKLEGLRVAVCQDFPKEFGGGAFPNILVVDRFGQIQFVHAGQLADVGAILGKDLEALPAAQ